MTTKIRSNEPHYQDNRLTVYASLIGSNLRQLKVISAHFTCRHYCKWYINGC